jgi:hypothetical protein
LIEHFAVRVRHPAQSGDAFHLFETDQFDQAGANPDISSAHGASARRRVFSTAG